MATIRYGTQEHALELPPAWRASWLAPASDTPSQTGEALIEAALARPVGLAPLEELAAGKRSAAILVPGKDRVAGAELYVPLLLDTLNAAGMPDEAIEIVLATGTHAHHDEEDARRVLGRDAVSRVRWRQHNCASGEHLKDLGSTSFGTRVRMDRRVCEADLRILTGRIIPHYFAGFGGGRKALLPGVSAVSTILQNHRRTLADNHGIHSAVRPCGLSGNPVHLDMVEAARLAGGGFVLNTLLDAEHRVVGAVAGELEAAHLAGCEQARRMLQLAVPAPFDVVVSSAGGWPYDCDFVQALKTAFDVQEIVRPGGALLWIAECPGGVKDVFMEWTRLKSREELEGAVRERYNLGGHNSILLRALTESRRVALWSGLPDAQVSALGLRPVHSLAEGLAWLRETLPAAETCAVVPFANITHATVRE